MDKLRKLEARCKCGVFLTINEHRSYYKNAQQKFDEWSYNKYPPEIDTDVKAKMIETDTMIHVRFYTNNSLESYQVWHYDLDAALDEALAYLPDVITNEATFEVIDKNGRILAKTSGSREEAKARAEHYASLYSQNHPVKIFEVLRSQI